MASRPPTSPIYKMRLPDHTSLIDMSINDISNMSMSDFNNKIQIERIKEKIKELSPFEMENMSIEQLKMQIYIENKTAKEGYCELCNKGPYVYSTIWDDIKLWLCGSCKNDLEN